MMRLFVGLEMPENVRDALSRLRGGLPRARWVAPENLHMTLCFVGEVDEVQAEDLDAALTGYHGRAFDLHLHGVDFFSHGRRHPHAMFVTGAMTPELAEVQGSVVRAVGHAGLTRERRKFRPHVTLARVRETTKSGIGEFLSVHGDFSLPPFHVDKIVLFRSFLGHDGANYEPLADYPLAEVYQAEAV